jgi:uncharacterized protein YjbI with pentapeptide repeats
MSQSQQQVVGPPEDNPHPAFAASQTVAANQTTAAVRRDAKSSQVVGGTSSLIKLALLGIIPLMLFGEVSWATVIYIRSADHTITLKRGMHELIVQRGDTVVHTRNFEVVRGKNAVLRITLEKNAGLPATKTIPSPTAAANRRAAEWVLSVGGYLYFSSDNTEGIYNKIDKVEDMPQGAFDITIVRLSEKQFDEADLKNLQGLTKLVQLELKSATMTGSGIAHLTKLPSLYYLNIGRAAITDEGMSHVAKLPKLSHLEANEVRFSDAGVQHLVGHPTLKTLGLSGANITDGCAVHLKRIPKMDFLSLHHALITDVTLAHLAEMKSLTRINLQNTKITDAGLRHLAKMEGLNYLDVRNTKITDAGLMHLKLSPKLTQLWANGMTATDQGMLDLNAAREAADLPAIKVSR